MVADEAEQRELFSMVLMSKGYCVDAVADAESALVLLADYTYAVLLTDYELPLMNGPMARYPVMLTITAFHLTII